MSVNQISEQYPFQSRFVEIDGLQMHYVDEGPLEGSVETAPVLVMLHGNPTWGFLFRSLILRLRKFARVVVPDHLGCGLSDKAPEKAFRALDRVGHLSVLIDQLKLKRFSLVMHDWGGAIGTGYAVRNPEKITGLCYFNTTLTEVDSLPSVIKFAAHPLTGKFFTQTTSGFVTLTTQFGSVKKLPAEVAAQYHRPFRTKESRKAIWDFVQDIPFDPGHASYVDLLDMADKFPLLASKPVQIIWGLKDLCFHRGMLKKVAAHFPTAEVVELPQAGHLVLEDEPERCGEILENFVARVMRSQQSDSAALSPAVGSAPAASSVLYERLLTLATQYPTADAVLIPIFKSFAAADSANSVSYKKTSFADLLATTRQYERGLTELGMRSGDRVLMLVTPGVEFLALAYAVMGRGATPLFLDPGMGRANLMRCIQDAAPDGLLGVSKAHLLRLKGNNLFPRLRYHLIAEELLPGASWVLGSKDLSFLKSFSSQPLPPVTAAPATMIAFTSGATGTPKGVIFSNDMLSRQLEIFRQTFGLENNLDSGSGAKDLPLLPIFSLFSVALGIASVIPPLDPAAPLSIDPAKVIRLIHDQSITYSFGSPTLWGKISEHALRFGTKFSSIRRVLIAGTDVSPVLIERLSALLPNGEVCTPYGATEALPVTFVTGHELLHTQKSAALTGEQGSLVGKASPGVLIKIIESTDQAISDLATVREQPTLQIGEIIVQGSNVSSHYLNRPDANIGGKIRSGDSVWHRMGDVGYLDQQGNLYYCGRKAHVVHRNTQAWFPVPVEWIFNRCQGIRRSALISFAGEPALAVETNVTTEAERLKLLTNLRTLSASSPLTKEITRFFVHPSFPVDARHNAKIFRDHLAIWAKNHPEAELR